ncbi:3569_t:CDS:2 [Cetraspora pellucida]|uniref:3569_t:CDS:1 n=1 Tax=Cetraspora pellucida TaxID=1433469 RepID=A0ACA9KU46_9GLOM|nr:3569_t:CDS:2 [Cetraspora pellucida]
MSSQGPSSKAPTRPISTSASLGDVFGRSEKSKNLSRMLLHPKIFLTSPRNQLKRFKLFCSKNKKFKNSADIKSINPPNSVFSMINHIVDDDTTSVCSFSTLDPVPSESWDDDFVLDNNEINVPNSVEEAQLSLRMDISNIRDFASQVEGFTRSTIKKYKDLENLFKQDWEEATVIIDLSDVAQDKQSSSNEDDSVKVKIERIPSERHIQVFKKIIIDELGEDAHNVIFIDDDKENYFDNNCSDSSNSSAGNTHSAKKQKLANGESSSNGGSNGGCDKECTKRKENFRISIEIMPSLIDHLKKLRNRLSEHLNELKTLVD